MTRMTPDALMLVVTRYEPYEASTTAIERNPEAAVIGLVDRSARASIKQPEDRIVELDASDAADVAASGEEGDRRYALKWRPLTNARMKRATERKETDMDVRCTSQEERGTRTRTGKVSANLPHPHP